MFQFSDGRYNRQEQMPEWGLDRQAKLKDANIAIIGAGGVKSTMLMILAAAGIGHIRIIEYDRVEISNLNRQLLYRTSDIGMAKVICASRTLSDLNPEIWVEPIAAKVDNTNITELCDDFEFIVEGGDSPAGRNLVNEYCLATGKPFVHASAQFSYGYVFSVVPTWRTACFACFFPKDHTRAIHTGPVPVNALSTSIAGSLGAAEVLKWFLGYRDRLIINRRLCFSSLLLSTEFVYEEQQPIPNCSSCAKHYNVLK